MIWFLTNVHFEINEFSSQSVDNLDIFQISTFHKCSNSQKLFSFFQNCTVQKRNALFISRYGAVSANIYWTFFLQVEVLNFQVVLNGDPLLKRKKTKKFIIFNFRSLFKMALNDEAVSKQIEHMIAFIKNESQEKVEEIYAKV